MRAASPGMRRRRSPRGRDAQGRGCPGAHWPHGRIAHQSHAGRPAPGPPSLAGDGGEPPPRAARRGDSVDRARGDRQPRLHQGARRGRESVVDPQRGGFEDCQQDRRLTGAHAERGEGDPGHPLRARLEEALQDFVDKCRRRPTSSPGGVHQGEVLDAEVVRTFSASIWSDAKHAITKHAASEEGFDPSTIERALVSLGRTVLADPALLARIDGWIADAALAVVDRYQNEIGDLISNTVKAWDPIATSRRIELASPRPPIHPHQRHDRGRTGGNDPLPYFEVRHLGVDGDGRGDGDGRAAHTCCFLPSPSPVPVSSMRALPPLPASPRQRCCPLVPRHGLVREGGVGVGRRARRITSSIVETKVNAMFALPRRGCRAGPSCSRRA